MTLNMKMSRDLSLCWFVMVVSLFVPPVNASDGPCTPIEIENGRFSGEGGGQFWAGNYSCLPGYVLVGDANAKCRDGQWSYGNKTPVCTAIGVCDPSELPQVKNARLSALKKYRQSVYKYRCRQGYKLHGQGKVHCDGSQWDIQHPPVCTKSGCNEEEMQHLEFGRAKSQAAGTIYRFHCKAGGVLVGSDMVFCDGHAWSDTKPICHIPASTPNLELATPILAGSPLQLSCNAEVGRPRPEITIRVGSLIVGSPTIEGYAVTINPDATMDGEEVTCEAKNNLMSEPAVAIQILHVYSESRAPTLYTDRGNDILKAGDTVSVTCQPDGGNPPPQLTILLNEETLAETVAHPASPESLSVPLRLLPQHHGANLTCRSQNSVMTRPATTSHQLAIHSPVTTVHLSLTPGDTIREGDTLRMKCYSVDGVPAPVLNMFLGKELIANQQSESYEVIEELVVGRELNGQLVTCTAKNQLMSMPIQTESLIQVHYPSSEPSITILNREPIWAGHPVKIRCSVSNGNPKPSLTMEMVTNDVDIIQPAWTQVETIGDDSNHTSGEVEVSFVAEAAHHGVEVKCEAINYLMNCPTVAKIKLAVNYGPSDVMLTGPDHVEQGRYEQVTCQSLPANPAPNITWTAVRSVPGHDDDPIELKEMESRVFEEDGGTWLTVSSVAVPPMQGPGKVKLTCFAWSGFKPIQRSLELPIHFAPSGVEISQTPDRVPAGQSFTAICHSTPSYPMTQLTWYIQKEDGLDSPQYLNGDENHHEWEDGSSQTQSVVSYTFDADDIGKFQLVCLGTQYPLTQLRETPMAIRDITIVGPSQLPELTSATDLNSVNIGDTVSLNCRAATGDDEARLVWRADQPRDDFTESSEFEDGYISSSIDLLIVYNVTSITCTLVDVQVSDEPMAASLVIVTQGQPLSMPEPPVFNVDSAHQYVDVDSSLVINEHGDDEANADRVNQGQADDYDLDNLARVADIDGLSGLQENGILKDTLTEYWEDYQEGHLATSDTYEDYPFEVEEGDQPGIVDGVHGIVDPQSKDYYRVEGEAYPEEQDIDETSYENNEANTLIKFKSPYPDQGGDSKEILESGDPVQEMEELESSDNGSKADDQHEDVTAQLPFIPDRLEIQDAGSNLMGAEASAEVGANEFGTYDSMDNASAADIIDADAEMTNDGAIVGDDVNQQQLTEESPDYTKDNQINTVMDDSNISTERKEVNERSTTSKISLAMRSSSEGSRSSFLHAMVIIVTAYIVSVLN